MRKNTTKTYKVKQDLGNIGVNGERLTRYLLVSVSYWPRCESYHLAWKSDSMNALVTAEIDCIEKPLVKTYKQAVEATFVNCEVIS